MPHTSNTPALSQTLKQPLIAAVLVGVAHAESEDAAYGRLCDAGLVSQDTVTLLQSTGFNANQLLRMSIRLRATTRTHFRRY